MAGTIEQRKHPRYGVHLAVQYTNAEQFVHDYVENLSLGGVFIAGAHKLPLLTETSVNIVLPGQGAWTVRARVVYLLDEFQAHSTGRKAGAGMQIFDKPPGFEDALLGYLLRLGHRRDHSVMVGAIPGVRIVIDAGYRTMPLEAPDEAAATARDALVKLVAIVVPPAQCERYRAALGDRAEIVFSATTDDEVHEVVERLDSLI